MTTDQIRNLLPQYLDGELSAAERAAVDEALGTVPELAGELERWRRFNACVRRAVGAQDLPEGFDGRCRAALNREGQRSRRDLVWRIGAVGLAAAAVIALFIFVLPLKSDNPVLRSGAATAGAVSVPLESFSRIWSHCGKHHHSILTGPTPSVADAEAALAGALPCAARVPDLASRGLGLRGCCLCAPGPVRAAHVFYAHDGGDEVVSVFSIAGKVTLSGCDQRGDHARGGYQEATRAGVSYIKWCAEESACVLVADVPLEQLRQIAVHLGAPEQS